MQAIKPERKNLIRILARIHWLHMMRQRTVVWDSKCEVRSVRTPFGEVQIFCPLWVAALIGNKEICFREITQFPSSVDNVFFRVCQVNIHPND